MSAQQVKVKIPKWVEKVPNKEELYLDFLVSMALVKMQDYKKETEIYQGKYKMPFEKFEKKILAQKKENPKWWDDYIVWKGYHQAYNKWADWYKETLQCMG